MGRETVIVAVFVLTIVSGGWMPSPLPANNKSRGFYTEEQAQRGKALFAQSCSTCHTVDRNGSRPTSLGGNDFMQEWYSVADLFSKTSMSMPADNVLGLSSDAYVNITAYMLQANGLPAGKDQLKRDRAAMRRMVLSPSHTVPGRFEPINEASDTYYTTEQARRGKAYFQGSCSLCHTAEPAGPNQDPFRPPVPSGMGMWLGNKRYFTSLAGDQVSEKWHNVGDLYNKIRTTMPGYDAGQLSPEMYVDMVAYLLEANGFLAGRKELRNDIGSMKAMTMVEKGFQRLFNGKDFTGFRFALGYNCEPRPSGCGQTEPGSTFRIEKEMIVCSGKPYGYMYTEEKYLNFTLRLEYRFKPYEGMETDDDFYGNSGYMLFITKHQVWPKSIEIQGRNSDVLSAIPIDSKANVTVDDGARQRAIKPVGQWNSVEIVSKNGQIRSYLNGTLISTVSEHEFKEVGHIGFQSEGAEIYWRNIRIKKD